MPLLFCAMVKTDLFARWGQSHNNVTVVLDMENVVAIRPDTFFQTDSLVLYHIRQVPCAKSLVQVDVH